MRLEVYTEKTIPQCLAALNERMQVKGTSSRPGLEGWVEKNGTFSLSVTTPVIAKFERTTTLHGKLTKGDGHTVVEINVSEGADRRGIILMFGAVAVIVLVLIASGNVLFALLLLPVAAYLYIPMRGDHENSASLVSDVQRALKTRATPPKRATGEKPTVRETKEAAKPTAKTAAKPAGAASKPAASAKPPAAASRNAAPPKAAPSPRPKSPTAP